MSGFSLATRHDVVCITLLACCSLLMASTVLADQTAAPAANATAGHCSFNLKNQWAGPYKACIDPSTPAQCDETGKRDENSGATHGAGTCPAAGRVGTCAKPDSALHYYEGEASGLEIGCGFQGGTWKAGS